MCLRVRLARRIRADFRSLIMFLDALSGVDLHKRRHAQSARPVEPSFRSGFSDDRYEAATGMTVTVSWEVEWLRYMSRRSEGSLASYFCFFFASFRATISPTYFTPFPLYGSGGL